MIRITFIMLLASFTISAQGVKENIEKSNFTVETSLDNTQRNEIVSAETLTDTENKHQFSVEIDPLPYILGGVGGHFGWSPKKSKHMSFGIGFVVNLVYPDALIDMNAKNKGEGWGVKINQGMGVWAHYYFKERNKGWFTGLQLFTQEIKLTNENFPNESDRTNISFIALQGGYVWYPFKKKHFYLRPWAGFAYQSVTAATFEPGAVDTDLNIGTKTYDLNPIQAFATFHIGYKF